jgi:glyoxylase-like metal-dependent hydrolase (beta-lactamase superfamily II)
MLYSKGIVRGFAIAGLSAFASLASAQGQGQPAAPFMVHQLKPNVYWVEGGGGNSGVIVGDKGVIVVDAKVSAAAGKELLDDIAKITPKPVTTVILTHSDGDHVNGLAAFPASVRSSPTKTTRRSRRRRSPQVAGAHLPPTIFRRRLSQRTRKR